MKISIVVPVYNTEKYLTECVNSILLQTFTDFEVILVDDGSKDKSGQICDRLSETDSRIKVFHQLNSGVTCARAKGVALAQGEWICFVDSDDTLPVDSLEKLNAGICDATDIVIGFCDNQKILTKEWINIVKYREMCITGKGVYPGPWARLIRRRIFDENTFAIPRTIVKGEDMLMNIRLSFASTKDIHIIPFRVYHYLSHSESCVHNFIHNCDYEYNFYKEKLCVIPQGERLFYRKYCIKNALKALHRIIRCSSSVKDWKESLFVAQLKKDVVAFRYRLSLLDYVLLMVKNDLLNEIFRRLL